jgi:hypothetical protein
LVKETKSLIKGVHALSAIPLFSKMEKELRDQHFHSNEDVQNKVKKELCAQDIFVP